MNQPIETRKTVIIGELHRENIHLFAEQIDGRYRLKTVSFQYFRTEKELLAYCEEQKAELATVPKKQTHVVRRKTSSSFGNKASTEPRQESCQSQKRTRTPSELNEKQKRFCDIYLMCRNATRAYMDANPSIKNANSAGACASSLLKKPAVREYLADRGLSLEARKPARKATEVSVECNHILEE